MDSPPDRAIVSHPPPGVHFPALLEDHKFVDHSAGNIFTPPAHLPPPSPKYANGSKSRLVNRVTMRPRRDYRPRTNTQSEISNAPAGKCGMN